MKTIFVKETDRKGTHIIEGEERPNHTLSIKRIICVVAEQETEAETQELADLIIEKLCN